MQLYPDHTWEVTTENGTRIILDLTEISRWMRLPAMRDDRRLNLTESDGRWCRLMMVGALVDGQVTFWEAIRGYPIRVWIGWPDWHTSANVLSVRRLLPAEVPRPVGKETP